jgi:hypothetical protein
MTEQERWRNYPMPSRFEQSLVPEKCDERWSSFHWFGLALMAAFVVIWVIIYAKIMSMLGGTAP